MTLSLAMRHSFGYDELSADGQEIARAAASRIRPLLHRSARDMVAIGNELMRVRTILPRGGFREWVELELGISIKMAERFMNVALQLGDKIDSLSILSPDALYALAAPSTPSGVIDDVIEGHIESTPKAIRAEIARRKETTEVPRQTQRAAWQALDALVCKYSNGYSKDVSAEILVRLAYICPCPTWKHLEEDLECYEDGVQRGVRKALMKLANSLTDWADRQ